MDVKDYMKAEQEKHLQEARSITSTAKEEGRNLTDTEKELVQKSLTAAREVGARREAIESDEAIEADIAELGEKMHKPATRVRASRKATTIGELFVTSEPVQALKAKGLSGNWTTGAIELPYRGKAASVLDTDGNDVVNSTDSGGVHFDELQTGVRNEGDTTLALADLFAQGTTSKAGIAYIQEKVADRVNGAAGVAEGDVKPPSYLSFEKKRMPVTKIATWLPIDDESLEDIDGMASYLNARLPLFVQIEEDDQLLNGTGGDDLDGILDQLTGTPAVAADVSGDNLYDAILSGITNVRTEGHLEPDALVMNAITFAKVSALRAVAGDGGYFSGGPTAGPAGTAWGKRIALSESMADGDVLVGAFKTGAVYFRKGGLTVEMSNSHADYFIKNQTAIRAERRGALVVYRPAAFCIASVS